jgi:hypothetical protein
VKTKIAKTTEDEFIERTGLAKRWKCHTETIRRKEKTGQLHPLYISSRLVRYRMSEVLALERAAMQ